MPTGWSFGEGQAFVDHFRGLLEIGRYSIFGQSLPVRKAAQNHAAFREHALRLVADDDYGLVLIHWPIPHPPFFHDRRTGLDTAANRGPVGYVDNLALTDRMLGEMLDVLDSSAIGARTSVIVTSDHWWRASRSLDGVLDERVPFIARLAGERSPVRWPDRFETVRTSELIVEVLEGRVRHVEQLTRCLSAANPSAGADAGVARRVPAGA